MILIVVLLLPGSSRESGQDDVGQDIGDGIVICTDDIVALVNSDTGGKYDGPSYCDDGSGGNALLEQGWQYR